MQHATIVARLGLGAAPEPGSGAAVEPRREMLPPLIERVTPRHTGTKGCYDVEITWTPLGHGLVTLVDTLEAGAAA